MLQQSDRVSCFATSAVLRIKAPVVAPGFPLAPGCPDASGVVPALESAVPCVCAIRFFHVASAPE